MKKITVSQTVRNFYRNYHSGMSDPCRHMCGHIQIYGNNHQRYPV